MLFGIAAIYAGYRIWNITPANLLRREKLARNVLWGMVFAVADLLWCIPHAKPLLPGALHVYLLPTAAVCAVLAYCYLDYLFARAIGGFFILLSYYFLHESFTLHTPAAPVLAVFCFAMGIVGIFFSGKPHLLRDFIRNAARQRHFRILKALLAAGFGGLSLVLGILQLCGRG